MNGTSVRTRITVVGGMVLYLTIASYAAGQDRLPNLRALPASELSVVVSSSGNPELRFSATSWNSGTGPF